MILGLASVTYQFSSFDLTCDLDKRMEIDELPSSVCVCVAVAKWKSTIIMILIISELEEQCEMTDEKEKWLFIAMHCDLNMNCILISTRSFSS